MGRTREQLTLPVLLFEVFEEEHHGDNLFMSPGELAYNGTGIEHRMGIKRKSPIKEHQVRNAMPQVKKIAERKGYILATQRQSQIPGGGKSIKIVAWRLATKDDTTYLIEDVEVLEKLRGNAKSGIERIISIGERTGLIPPKDIKKLREGNTEDEPTTTD